jgi:hypothetical protein
MRGEFFGKKTFILTVGMPALVVLPFLVWGYPIGHDFEGHMQNWAEVAQSWREGTFLPQWAAWANFASGEPRFIFYPPLSWTLGPAIGLIAPWRTVPGIYIWICIPLAGLAMHRLARFAMPDNVATMAGAVFACNPYNLLVVYQRVALAELLAAALFPLLVLFILRLGAERRHAVVPLALVFGAIWLANAPAAVIASYSALSMVLVLSALRADWRILIQAAVSLAAGLGLAAFYIVPAALQQQWVNISALLDGVANLRANFFFSTNPAVYFAFNHVISITTMAQLAILVVAIAMLRHSRRLERNEFGLVMLVLAVVSSLLMFPISLPVWNSLPRLLFVQFPWRWLFVFNAAFASVVALAIAGRWRRGWVPVMILVLGGGLWAGQTSWRSHAVERAHQSIESGRGYPGKVEYLPKGASLVPALASATPVVMVEPAPADSSQVRVERWIAESKVFSVDTAVPAKAFLRLLNYPGWKAEVNGHAVSTLSDPATGRIVISVPAGHSRVQVDFVPAAHRFYGTLLSGFAALLLTLILLRAS